MSKRGDSYKEAGVDIRKADDFIRRIKPLVAGTHVKGVMTDIGGFGGLFKLDTQDMNEPVLVASTDGVGTKLKLAFAFDVHDTIGVDLVAMSVNDVLVQGAKPLFFLDYFATGKLDPDKAESVVRGIAKGCKAAGCALLGGETAEMPDFYAPGEYDLSGFCVGVVDNKQMIDGRSIRPDDVIIGLASSGLHSNGFSLVRKILDESGLTGNDLFPGTKNRVSEILLQPTKIYVAEVMSIMRDIQVNGMVHITGGGFYDNIPRMIQKGLSARISFGSWDIPPVMNWVREGAGISWEEMLQIFNCGIGYVIICPDGYRDDVLSRLNAMDCPAWEIGRVVESKKGMENVFIDF
ncbi:phosphoribosylformylglycinamidine cyclo-ligase [Desulfonatronovibrio hydrogenovorans]|uniref:phosphoribosylformylglycinamidine cyclo-ligase n=1 Tax=Desulfonatronovibrio hydrogenovorans TaxID=53245 RepID=UPI000491C831|nr:phosphoribosylformylglycinamidine cyclo-ligase [Desulfonatronovibrio hydrogenovorans]